MDDQKQTPIKAAVDRRVPDELLARLHAANQRLHDARQGVEQAVVNSDYGHQKQVNHAADDLRAAEKAVEDISLEIHNSLHAFPDDQ